MRSSKREQERLVRAFVQGAKWWEYQKTKATMWPSDQRLAEITARGRMAVGTLGRKETEVIMRRRNMR